MKSIVTTLLLSVFMCTTAHAQLKAYLEIEGIQGDSTDQGHIDEIDVESWSQSVANVNSMPVVLPFVFTHRVDSATPELIAAALIGNGGPMRSATLDVVQSGGPGPAGAPFFTLTLNDAKVVAVENGGAVGGDNLFETVTMTCATFELSYAPVPPLPPGPQVMGSCGN